MRIRVAITIMIFYILSSVGSVIAFAEEPATEPISQIVFEGSIENTAGILPDSMLYGLERALERLQLAITSSENRLATLQAKFAMERASESVIMTTKGSHELAEKAAKEYQDTLAAATEHLNKAIEASATADKALAAVSKAYTNSELVLKTVLEKAPESTKLKWEKVLAHQDLNIEAVEKFYTAKVNFFAAKEEFEAAKKALAAARKSGKDAEILAAEVALETAELEKNRLEAIKDELEVAKEEIKQIIEDAEKALEQADQQLEKANEAMDKAEEKSAKDAEKAAEKAQEQLKKADEKAKEEAKKAAEKVREESEDEDDDDDEDDKDDDDDHEDDHDEDDDDDDDEEGKGK